MERRGDPWNVLELDARQPDTLEPHRRTVRMHWREVRLRERIEPLCAPLFQLRIRSGDRNDAGAQHAGPPQMTARIEPRLSLLGLAAEECRHVKIVRRDLLADFADVLLYLMDDVC